jgi:S1-C subfamily serine protease
LNIVAGLVLAGMAHRTRGRFTPGIVAPFIAHLFFNLTILGVPLLALTFGLPQAAAVFAALSSIAGVVTLWYNWRAARKDRAAALKHAGSAAALLLVAALTAGLVSNGLQPRGAVESSFLASRNQPYTAAAAGAASAADPKAPVDATVETPSPEPAAASPSAPAEMIARVKPSVVKVVVKEAKGYSIGSGVIVSPDGVVVTNGHVVGDGHKVGDVVSVRLSNGLKVPALIIAVNHNRDLALLKLPPLKSGKPWPISPFASHAPREGDVVYAMGHPLGLPFTVTKGILSGIGARGNSFVTYLQHDAAITHGNSGGPLYNEAGEIIAINTLGHEAGGIAFSIITPSVVAGLQQFAATGNMDTAALGIIINLSSPDQPEKGVVIELVRPGSAADKAGLRAGDLIIGIGDAELKDGGEDGVHQLGSILAKAKPGDKLPLGILRGDKQKILEVTLDARKTSEATSLAHNFDGEDAEP